MYSFFKINIIVTGHVTRIFLVYGFQVEREKTYFL